MSKHPVSRGFGGWAGIGIGIAASVLIEAVGPQLMKSAEPAARSALKFFFRVSDEVARSAARSREKVEDFVASTRSEYEAELAAAPAADGRDVPEGTA